MKSKRSHKLTNEATAVWSTETGVPGPKARALPHPLPYALVYLQQPPKVKSIPLHQVFWLEATVTSGPINETLTDVAQLSPLNT